MPQFKKTYADHKGPDLLSNHLGRPEDFFSSWLNADRRDDGSICKKPGWKPVGLDLGGCGLFTHTVRDLETGNETQEMLTVFNDRLYRAVPLTLTIAYTGAATACLVHYWYDTSTSQYRFRTYEDGVQDLNIACGVGTDEGSSFPVKSASALESDIDGDANYTASLSGTGTSTSAAFFFPNVHEHDLTDGPLTLSSYIWEAVNSPLADIFRGTESAKDSDPDFELLDSTKWDALTYWATPYTTLESGLVKYDGQTCYLAGMPEAPAPALTEVAASGVAEVTSIACIADLGAAEISQIEFNDSGAGGAGDWGGTQGRKWFLIGDSGGIVGVQVKLSSQTPSADPPEAYRTIVVSYANNDTNAEVAEAVKVAIDAEAAFTATRSGAIVTITNASSGDVASIAYPVDKSLEDYSDITTLQEGVSGLHEKWFALTGATGRHVFYYDIDNTGTAVQPSAGVATYHEIDTVAASDTASAVATATEAVIEALEWGGSVSSNVITVTDDATGARTDAEAGTSGFTVSVSTQGVNAGLGASTFLYHLTYQQVDAQGITTEGLESDDASITHSDGAKNTEMVIGTIQDDRGFNTGCAVVDGSQSAVNTITVESGHTLLVGDQATIKMPPTTAAAQVETITCVADVASSLDGTYFFLFSSLLGTERATAFWIDVDNNGTAEPAHGAPASEEITGITAGMTDAQVATVVAAEIDAKSEWAASAVGAVITVTHSITGPVTDGYDGGTPTTFAFAVTTNGRASAPGELVTRRVTAVAATTITVDGDPVSVTDNEAISNGLTIRLWRTEQDGPTISKFLLDEIPNNSFVESITYTDSTLDVDLGTAWVQPEFDRGLPPICRHVVTWHKALVVDRGPLYPSIVHHSIPFEFTPECFAPDAHQYVLYSDSGDQCRGLWALEDGIIAFKDRSFFVVTGDIFTGILRIDKRSQRDMGFMSNTGIVEIEGSLLYADKKGIFSVGLGDMPTETTRPIRPRFTDNIGVFEMRRAVGFYDRIASRIIYSLPSFTTLADDSIAVDPATSHVAVFNATHGNWLLWDNLDASGGMVEFNGSVFFQGWVEDAAGVRTHHLCRLSNEPDNPYAFQDHTAAIDAEVGTAWYSGSSPSSLKSFNFIKPYAEGTLTSVEQPITITTERDLVVGTAHSLFNWDPTSASERLYRLLPSKVRRMRFLFANDDPNTNMLLTQWEIEGVDNGAQEISE